MANSRIVLLTLLALLAFAGNSLLCRAALAILGGIALVVLKPRSKG